MKASRRSTWARLKVYFGALLLVVFALGALLIYASSLAEPERGHGRSRLLTVGAELMALSVIAGVFGAVLKRRLSRDD
jgi:cell division protein FtsW (lipid II flippase)